MFLLSLGRLVTVWRPPLALSWKEQHLFELSCHLYYLGEKKVMKERGERVQERARELQSIGKGQQGQGHRAGNEQGFICITDHITAGASDMSDGGNFSFPA